jgi:hypothetical protein
MREMTERKIVLGKSSGNNHSDDQCIGRRISLKWVFRKLGLLMLIEFIWFRTGSSGGLF